MNSDQLASLETSCQIWIYVHCHLKRIFRQDNGQGGYQEWLKFKVDNVWSVNILYFQVKLYSRTTVWISIVWLDQKHANLDLHLFQIRIYSKTCVKWTLWKDRKSIFKTNYRLMQVKSIAECSKGSILQYFWPSLSYHLSLRSLFCLFLSGSFKQALLYLYQFGD